jgi:FixJ family two-component response regulator
MQLLMKSANLSVQTYTSAREFLASYEPSKSGCLLVDIEMPDMDGLELQELLNRQKFTLPIIIVAGYSDVSRVKQVMKAGAFDFIEKPIPMAELLERVQKALRFSQNRC